MKVRVLLDIPDWMVNLYKDKGGTKEVIRRELTASDEYDTDFEILEVEEITDDQSASS